MVAVDEGDTLPRAGERVLGCRHVIVGNASAFHWYRHTEAVEINAPDGRKLEVRFMIACNACHGRIQKGKPALALMSGDRLWTEEDVAAMAGKEPKAST